MAIDKRVLSKVLILTLYVVFCSCGNSENIQVKTFSPKMRGCKISGYDLSNFYLKNDNECFEFTIVERSLSEPQHRLIRDLQKKALKQGKPNKGIGLYRYAMKINADTMFFDYSLTQIVYKQKWLLLKEEKAQPLLRDLVESVEEVKDR